MFSHKILYMNVYSSIICHSQKVDNPNIGQRMDIQNVVCPYNGVLLHNKKSEILITLLKHG